MNSFENFHIIFCFIFSHHAQNSRSTNCSAFKFLLPVFLVAILNTLPIFFERRIFHCLSSSRLNCSEKLASLDDISSDVNDTKTIHEFPDLAEFKSIDAIPSFKEHNYGFLEKHNMNDRLVDGNLFFNTLQVFSLTMIPLALLAYYNLRILHGVIERQKMLIPRKRKDVQTPKTKKKEKGKKYNYESRNYPTISTSNQQSVEVYILPEPEKNIRASNAITFYPTIGIFKQTTDLLMLPLTIMNADIQGSRVSNCANNSIQSGIPFQRQYEDKFALGNMVGNINLYYTYDAKLR